MDPRTLFEQVCLKLGVQPDRHGEAHVACPFCGKAAARGQVHFSFSESGGHCFVCGRSASLYALAKTWGQDPPVEQAPVYRRRTGLRQCAAAKAQAFGELATRYASHERRVELWQQYKPLPAEVIEAYRLGVGAFPIYTSQCRHYRLMVPLTNGSATVGFRGRAFTCDCPRWLSPAGSRLVLYNGQRLGIRHQTLGICAGDRVAKGRVLFVVENPVDALMLEQMRADIVAVATLGVTVWDDAWTGMVREAGAEVVFVAYDNDRPGNGGGVQGREDWLRAHGADIMPSGVRLVNALLAAGVRARLFRWPAGAKLHMDIGDLLAGAV